MEIGKILSENNFEFKKKLGQNFILDTNFQKSIVADCKITNQDEVLEIGTGAGTLTLAISDVAKKVVTYEKDDKLQPILNNILTPKNITVKYADILSLSLEEIEKDFEDTYTMIANLPYYITTPIIFHFLKSKHLKCLNIMVQQEVADRICAQPSTKDYGILTAMIGFYGNAKIVRKINRNMYVPSPNVDSAMVRIELTHDFPQQLENTFNQLVHKSFAMRRKTLRNNLSHGFNLDNEIIDEVLKDFSPSIRAENLSVKDFINLSKKLIDKI